MVTCTLQLFQRIQLQEIKMHIKIDKMEKKESIKQNYHR